MTALIMPQTSLAQARLKLVTLTADWCARCQVLESALARALETMPPGSVETVEIDLTHIRRGKDARDGISAASQARLAIHKAGWIWEAHGLRTGLAFIIDARTGAPLACLTSAVPSGSMASQLTLAARLASADNPVSSSKWGTDCPHLIG